MVKWEVKKISEKRTVEELHEEWNIEYNGFHATISGKINDITTDIGLIKNAIETLKAKNILTEEPKEYRDYIEKLEARKKTLEEVLELAKKLRLRPIKIS